MSNELTRPARLPPRWVVRLAWKAHRAIYRVTRGHVGLWSSKPNRWGAARLTTIGRRSGEERSVILGYVRDGPNLVTLAMNGWAESEPAWWLNLRANPEATVELASGRQRVRGRAASGEERDRLWAQWQELDTNLDAYAARRPGETAVVILEPTSDSAGN
ncbi:nitroreductase/quinone reductase family protein [Haloechinothrix salitolerans]|uniref:Nitroreductase/quinone reductase family protein n=1 Tax=Haloechinothrix salitolerans TaxID=926830 RepID=A0ABW2CAI6_9PSEU